MKVYNPKKMALKAGGLAMLLYIIFYLLMQMDISTKLFLLGITISCLTWSLIGYLFANCHNKEMMKYNGYKVIMLVSGVSY